MLTQYVGVIALLTGATALWIRLVLLAGAILLPVLIAGVSAITALRQTP